MQVVVFNENRFVCFRNFPLLNAILSNFLHDAHTYTKKHFMAFLPLTFMPKNGTIQEENSKTFWFNFYWRDCMKWFWLIFPQKLNRFLKSFQIQNDETLSSFLKKFTKTNNTIYIDYGSRNHGIFFGYVPFWILVLRQGIALRVTSLVLEYLQFWIVLL